MEEHKMAWDYAEHAKPCERYGALVKLLVTVLYSNVLKLFTYNNKNYRHWYIYDHLCSASW